METWVWQGISVALPDDWEMLQFSRKPAKGRCAFADRYGFRFELSWETVAGPPDMEHMVSSYLDELKKEGSMPDARVIAPGGIMGIKGHLDLVLTTRFSHYLEEPSRVVETTFFWPGGIEKHLQREVLGSVKSEPVHEGGFARWRAFGMELLASATLSLTACSVAPASAHMTFGRRGEEHGPEEHFRRLGMTREWLRGTVKEWLVLEAPRGVARGEPYSRTVSGHDITMVQGECTAGRMARLLRTTRRYRAAAWICPVDGRLYNVTRAGWPESEARGPELAGGRLVCCESLRSHA